MAWKKICDSPVIFGRGNESVFKSNRLFLWCERWASCLEQIVMDAERQAAEFVMQVVSFRPSATKSGHPMESCTCRPHCHAGPLPDPRHPPDPGLPRTPSLIPDPSPIGPWSRLLCSSVKKASVWNFVCTSLKKPKEGMVLRLRSQKKKEIGQQEDRPWKCVSRHLCARERKAKDLLQSSALLREGKNECKLEKLIQSELNERNRNAALLVKKSGFMNHSPRTLSGKFSL